MSFAYVIRQRLAREAFASAELNNVAILLDQAKHNPGFVQAWDLARRTAFAAGRAIGDPQLQRAGALRVLVAEIETGASAASRDGELVRSVAKIRTDPNYPARADVDYADAFRRAGLDIDGSPPAELGTELRGAAGAPGFGGGRGARRLGPCPVLAEAR